MRMKESIVLAMAIAAVVLIATVGNASSATPIANCTELQNIREGLNGNYYLANEINCFGFDYGDGKGFLPIGNLSNHFTGTFDGQGNKITGLHIDRSSTDYVGLFGQTGSGSEIKSVGLEEVNSKGNAYTAGLVGCNYGIISNVYSTGSVNGGEKFGGLGGLVGRNWGTITNSYSTSSVSGSSPHTGGLVGYNYEGTIENSYSIGTVSSSGGYVGGLVGYNWGTINNSYSTGSVGGGNTVGGLGGGNGMTIENSYWDIYRSNQDSCLGWNVGTADCTGKNAGNSEPLYWSHRTNPPMDMWDFGTIWKIEEGKTYPCFRWQASPCPPVPDLPAIILFGAGLLVIVLYAVSRRCSRR